MKVKPLLVIPPASTRWRALSDLLATLPEARLRDLLARFVDGLDDAQDALALIPDGPGALACAGIRRRGPIGVFGELFTDTNHRRKGLARMLTQTLLSWFDMTGGAWLYCRSEAPLFEGFLQHFGFRALHRAASDGQDCVAALRTPGGTPPSPFKGVRSDLKTRDLTRADWPLIVALLQHFDGPDARVPAAESALAAETAALDLIDQQESGKCKLLGACRGERVVGVASVALDRTGERTHAMVLPHGHELPALRERLAAWAAAKGYRQVDFPFEMLDTKAESKAESAGAGTKAQQARSDDDAREPPVETG